MTYSNIMCSILRVLYKLQFFLNLVSPWLYMKYFYNTRKNILCVLSILSTVMGTCNETTAFNYYTIKQEVLVMILKIVFVLLFSAYFCHVQAEYVHLNYIVIRSVLQSWSTSCDANTRYRRTHPLRADALAPKVGRTSLNCPSSATRARKCRSRRFNLNTISQ